jgi:uncharacterized membrane protein
MDDSNTNITNEVASADALYRQLKRLLYVGVLAIVIVAGLYAFQFSGSLSTKTETWGQFGDYVGGLLNPTFSFLALIALLATFNLQVRELRISALELRNSAEALVKQNATLQRQNFEASFFQLLRLHNDIVARISIPNGSTRIVGRECFAVLVHRLEVYLRSEGGATNLEMFRNIYGGIFYMQYQNDLGHYFRMLYNITKLVKATVGIDQRFYTNLIRAQLSGAEITLLFYNCLSDLGNERFKPLVEEFALLKTIPTTLLPSDELLNSTCLTHSAANIRWHRFSQVWWVQPTIKFTSNGVRVGCSHPTQCKICLDKSLHTLNRIIPFAINI